MPVDMIFQGMSMSLFQAQQQWSRMSAVIGGLLDAIIINYVLGPDSESNTAGKTKKLQSEPTGTVLAWAQKIRLTWLSRKYHALKCLNERMMQEDSIQVASIFAQQFAFILLPIRRQVRCLPTMPSPVLGALHIVGAERYAVAVAEVELGDIAV